MLFSRGSPSCPAPWEMPGAGAHEASFSSFSLVLRSQDFCFSLEPTSVHADDERDHDTSPTWDAAKTSAADSGARLVDTATAGNALVYIDVDSDPLTTEGARQFEQDSTVAASALWHCERVKVVQLVLLSTSSIQLILGLIFASTLIGIPPLISSILGIVTSIHYFVGDVRSLEKALTRVRNPSVLRLRHCSCSKHFIFPS
jgi:hypothetical protein